MSTKDANVPAKAEQFSAAKAPPELLRAVKIMDVQGGGANIVESVLELVEFDYEIEPFTRQDARDLVSFVRREAELDEMVLAPTDTDYLDSKINRALARDLDRILEENAILEQIAKKQDGKVFAIEGSGEKVTPQRARDYLNRNTQRILEIKKSLSEQKKNNQAGEGGSPGVNLTFDLRSVVSDGVRRIKEAEANVIDV